MGHSGFVLQVYFDEFFFFCLSKNAGLLLLREYFYTTFWNKSCEYFVCSNIICLCFPLRTKAQGHLPFCTDFRCKQEEILCGEAKIYISSPAAASEDHDAIQPKHNKSCVLSNGHDTTHFLPAEKSCCCYYHHLHYHHCSLHLHINSGWISPGMFGEGRWKGFWEM